jgi:hypothetical protein
LLRARFDYAGRCRSTYQAEPGRESAIFCRSPPFVSFLVHTAQHAEERQAEPVSHYLLYNRAAKPYISVAPLALFLLSP